MALVLEVVVWWVLLSLAVAVVLGAVISRAGRMAEERETLLELVPDALPPSMSGRTGSTAAVEGEPDEAAAGDVLHLRLLR